MAYNPIFDEELSSARDLRELRKYLSHRAGFEHIINFKEALLKFVKAHPIFCFFSIFVFVLSALW